MKKFISILVVCVFSLILIIGNAVTKADYFPEEKSIKSVVTEADYFSEEESIKSDNYIEHTKSVKDSLYYEYIIGILESEIKNINNVLDCKIDINISEHKPVAANVKVITKDDKIDVLQADIKNYISQYLDISYQDVSLIFNWSLYKNDILSKKQGFVFLFIELSNFRAFMKTEKHRNKIVKLFMNMQKK